MSRSMFATAVFSFNYFIGISDHFQYIGIRNISAPSKFYPIFSAHIFRDRTGWPRFMQFGNAFWLPFHSDSREIIHIDHAKHMVTHIKHQYRIKSCRKTTEWRLLRNPLQRETIFPELLNIHESNVIKMSYSRMPHHIFQDKFTKIRLIFQELLGISD